MNNAIQNKKEFYTLESREESRFSEFKKSFDFIRKTENFFLVHATFTIKSPVQPRLGFLSIFTTTQNQEVHKNI